MSVWGDNLDGRDYNTQRTYGMTETIPPEDYQWHHSTLIFGQGNDIVATEYNTKADFRELRLNWLDQFDLEIQEEDDYRIWRWYDEERTVRWSERRPVAAPLPKVPGFWPSDE